MLEGIIGLFVGAVVLAVGYTLFGAWMRQATEEDEAMAPTALAHPVAKAATGPSETSEAVKPEHG